MTATDTLIEQRASAAPRVTPADLEAGSALLMRIDAGLHHPKPRQREAPHGKGLKK